MVVRKPRIYIGILHVAPTITLATHKLWNAACRITVLRLVVQELDQAFQNVARHVREFDHIVLRFAKRALQHHGDRFAVVDRDAAIEEELVPFR